MQGQDGSVGTLPSGAQLLMEDVKDLSDPMWPWEAFAAHATQASLRSLATNMHLHTLRIQEWKVGVCVYK